MLPTYCMRNSLQCLEQLKLYTKAKDAFEDAKEEFQEGAFTDAGRKARDSDKLFSLSKFHDHKLLCKELVCA